MVLDLVVVGILLVSAIVAFLRGFVREVLTIGSLAGAGVATLMFGPSLKPMVQGWIIDPNATEPQRLFGLIPYEMLVPVVAFAIVFVATLVLLTIITHLISKGVHSVGLGPVDRSLGVAFGLIRGAILVGLMGLVLNFVLSDAQRDEYLSESKTYPMVDYTAQLMQALMPGKDVLDKVHKDKTKDALDQAMDNSPTTPAPVEPGQNSANTGNNSNRNMPDFAAIRRKAAEAAAKETQEQVRARVSNFNE